ncbi:PREDICTED: trafficking protein particle complex subunit 13-like [Priapulus caudatus]|uniref:Trafficking protein particle complex subunit 13-like n=1 Tax=Priapulus caudatus TaxID=37621 RepID=A0ABM1ELN8_PRICU|nr:PREDICTED: trafficking protein particle complex subunit 13-like [Priapulus caudatus]
MEAGKDREHLLALKVMRLTKPSFFSDPRLPVDPHDLTGSLQHTMSGKIWAVESCDQFPISDLLTLPQSFGNIFLGETFTSCISIHNESDQLAKDVAIKADLQTSSQRVSLSANTPEVIQELAPDASIDDVISHEVKELGTHILVCAVSYTTLLGEKLYFRKFFKFQVLKPIDVKTKFYNYEDEMVYLEVQIQNITSSLICMEKVVLEPSALYSVKNLNTVNTSQKTTFGDIAYLGPLDTRQFLYCLHPVPGSTDWTALHGVTVIGKLDIIWKSNMGEKGRLQTSPLQRMAPGHGDIRFELISSPDVAELEKTLHLTCKLTNCVERTMELGLSLQNYHQIGLLWCGIANKQLGRLEANSSMELNLKILYTKPGLQSISGIRVTDTFLKRTYEYDDIGQVLVMQSVC